MKRYTYWVACNALGMGAVLLSISWLATSAGCVTEVEENEVTARLQEKLIYGTDDRLEYGQASSVFRAWADSTAMLVVKNRVSCANGTCALTSQNWTKDIPTGSRLCSGVHYRSQSTLGFSLLDGAGGFCTGFLVAPNLIVSAAHCLYDAWDCNMTSFVFGYTADANGGSIPTSVPQDNVYSCASVAKIVSVDDYINTGEDWIIYKLDRPVSKRPPLNVRHSGAVSLNQSIAMIGHPNLLPMKISPTGAVTGVSETFLFSHNIDSFEGNSGSPVFGLVSGVVEGIHVLPPPGVSHFFDSTDESGACVAETTCGTSGCPGYSGATRITRLSNYIPLTPTLIMATCYNNS
jgi:V8-like Glu-specific endopeptidase